MPRFISGLSVKFHLAYMYITHQLKQDIGRGYTQDKPEISNAFLSTSFYNTLTADFYVSYRQWLRELRQNQRSFVPFNLTTEKLSDSLTGIAPKSSFKAVRSVPYFCVFIACCEALFSAASTLL